MHTATVSPHIERLVDHLRASDNSEISIGDVAGITEVLLTTMQRYFNSLDLTIYDEFRNLSDHIQAARREIAQLRPDHLKEEKIPRAGAELEAIVQATEEATGTIMDSAEEIMSADPTDLEQYQATVNDACMRIFEACSFQDITGQRINKVVSTLTFIEERLASLKDTWGPQVADLIAETDDEKEDDDDRRLLNGPALSGEGIQQDDIDRLLSGSDDEAEAEAQARAEPKATAKPVRKDKAATDIELNSEPAGESTASQAEIDALFD